MEEGRRQPRRRRAPCCRSRTPTCAPWPRRKSTRLEPELARIEEELKILLLPKDPNDEKNVVLEIRAGTGGDEATLFAAEIFRMYSRYAESQRWKMEVTSSQRIVAWAASRKSSRWSAATRSTAS